MAGSYRFYPQQGTWAQHMSKRAGSSEEDGFLVLERAIKPESIGVPKGCFSRIRASAFCALRIN